MMESTMGNSSVMDEVQLMKDQKYRVYMSNVDKALKNFEYSSEWADLISALGKLNKVISNFPKYKIIPRRIKISKRLAQCMHPALPSGVHLKALESYDVIFQNTGSELANELFIYSSGLFPLLGYAAMNVRPTLLNIYEKYFVPLGNQLRPALSGFLSGVLPGYEAGLDYFEQTNSLLGKVANAVGDECFYTCLWECVATNASIRLPAVTYILDQFCKKAPLAEQSYFLGRNHDIMMAGLCACLNDNMILVQRNALEYLLIAFPIHNAFRLSEDDLIRLVTNALNTILRRDMSLNRRLYSWILGTEVTNWNESTGEGKTTESYFEMHSKVILIKALKLTLKMSLHWDPIDLRPYKILIALLDKVEIGPQVLDFVLIDVIRTMALSLKYDSMAENGDVQNVVNTSEIHKSANLLFATLDPEYIWNFMTSQYNRSAKRARHFHKSRTKVSALTLSINNRIKVEVNSGLPSLLEVCFLTEFLLESMSLEMYNETTRVYLPKVFLSIVQMLTQFVKELNYEDVIGSLSLCMKIVARIQPLIASPARSIKRSDKTYLRESYDPSAGRRIGIINLEKSKSDSKIHKADNLKFDIDDEQNGKTAEEEVENIRRAESNQNIRKSPRKGTKKSKSYSKLGEIESEDVGNSAATGPTTKATTESRFIRRLKKSPMAKLKNRKSKDGTVAVEQKNGFCDEISSSISADTQEPDDEAGPMSDIEDYTSLDSEMSPGTSMMGLEQCIKQFEVFFHIYLARNILNTVDNNPDNEMITTVEEQLSDMSINDEFVAHTMFQLADSLVKGNEAEYSEYSRKIDEIFATFLLAPLPAERSNLKQMLNQSLNDDDANVITLSGAEAQDIMAANAGEHVIEKLMNLRIPDSLRKVIRLASNLLVEMSTFPTSNQDVVQSKRSAVHSISPIELPEWLKVLLVCGCYMKGDKEAQINCISALFDMVSLLKSQHEPHAISSPEVTSVIMMPLLQISDVRAIEERTRIFHMLSSILWDYLGEDTVNRHQVADLLYQLHNSIESGLVEAVIGQRISNSQMNYQFYSDAGGLLCDGKQPALQRFSDKIMDRMRIICPTPFPTQINCNDLSESDIMMFKKFEFLWQSSRDKSTKRFEQILLRVLDNLRLPTYMPMRSWVSNWLQECLMRGDLGPLLQPLLLLLLTPSSKRIGVVHVHLQLKGNQDQDSVTDIWYNPETSASPDLTLYDDLSLEAVCDGNELADCEHSGDSDDNEHVIDKMIRTKDGIVTDDPPSPGVIPNDDSEQSSFESVNSLDNKRFVGTLNHIGDVMSEHDRTKNKKNYPLSSPIVETMGQYMDQQHARDEHMKQRPNYLGETPISLEKMARKKRKEGAGADDGESQPMKTTFDWEKSKMNVNILRENNKRTKKYVDKIHPLHSHILLYSGSYNTKQVLYAFETLINMVKNEPRTFLCLSMTTTISDVTIKSLLSRHRKSVSGRKFEGVIANTEFSHSYRSCMYLEGLITSCLYYMRSYFQVSVDATLQSPVQVPTGQDIRDNCKIQFATVELLTVLCTELIAVVKEMGKGFASYIADLMCKCKLQKIVLHCILTSVLFSNNDNDITYTHEILRFNDPGPDYEPLQIALLKLLLAVTKLEYEVNQYQKTGDMTNPISTPYSNSNGNSETTANGQVAGHKLSPDRTTIPSTAPTNAKYLSNCPISQQPMFLSAILNALQADHLRHLHKNWTDFTIASLNYLVSGSLTNIVISVVHQICNNLDKITAYKGSRVGSKLAPDYILIHTEALMVLAHFCLLDNTQQMSIPNAGNSIFSTNQAPGLSGILSGNIPTANQVLTNLMQAFLITPLSGAGAGADSSQTRTSIYLAARNAMLNHLPRIIASVTALWDHELGQERAVNKQLLEFLAPICLHHSSNFLTAMAVIWQDRGEQHRKHTQLFGKDKNSSNGGYLHSESSYKLPKAFPDASPNQLSLVKLIAAVRLMPLDSFVQTVQQVIKQQNSPHPPLTRINLDVSALELFYFYMKATAEAQMTDLWPSLLAFIKDGILLPPPGQFAIMAILYEFVQRCPQMPFQDKKDLRDLHEITAKLVESISNIGGSCLEQTTWLRRNLAVKEDNMQQPLESAQQYSVQAQAVLAGLLANLLDISYGSQEKDKVVVLITTIMCYITPYLRNHSIRNIPSFMACSSLLASLSTYQYSRKAWRKEVSDLLLDVNFFQMDICCLPYWKVIIDSLMTCDNTTFRELMNRVSLSQTGSLNLFASKESEYEMRASSLKRLAFVIFCSEFDQYHKYMPEIQEQLVNSLRLPQVVPSVQAAVLLCFRVLLLRMSPDYITSLWPIIIAEMVQVFLAMEQELSTDADQSSNKTVAGINSSWASNINNGSYSNGHWRMVQLETAKLLELGCVLPATNLPHFQMYRWAFVAGINNDVESTRNDSILQPIFIPHLTRISRLMDLRFTTHSPRPDSYKRGKHLSLTCQYIESLQDLYGFFSTLSITWPPYQFSDIDKEVKSCLQEIESILALDFLEKMPQIASSTSSASVSLPAQSLGGMAVD